MILIVCDKGKVPICVSYILVFCHGVVPRRIKSLFFQDDQACFKIICWAALD